MRKLTLTCLAASLYLSSASYAQTLFTYGDKPVSKQEFLSVYQKNNINKPVDYSEKALREYLDLYTLFKMRVNEANLQQIDTISNIAGELDNYRKQIAKTYLTDEQVTRSLVTEAYDRSKEEVEVAHIMLSCPPTSTPDDTLRIYKKIDSLYNSITKKKATFESIAAQFSEDRTTKDKNGYIGYITALQTVYPFENAIYNTKAGQVSTPFRTQFGYHIVKVINRRPASGEIKVAQILINVQKSKGPEAHEEGKRKAEEVLAKLKQGASFEKLVEEYSDDKFTKDKNGEMPAFGVGRMVPAFESAAFALKNKGDISPVVETEYGFHIIKLLDRTSTKPLDSQYATLKKRIESDSRSQTARDSYFEKVKKKHNFKEYPANMEAIYTSFAKLPDTGKDAGAFKADDYLKMQNPVFEIGGQKFSQYDFIKFAAQMTNGRINNPRKPLLQDVYRMYTNNVINDFEEHQLAEENPEFKSLMEEYRNGITLFELMDRNVWSKASKDSTGLQNYYEKNKGKYNWEPGFKGIVYKFSDEAAKNKGYKLLKQKGGITEEELVKAMNVAPNTQAVNIQKGRFEYSKITDFKPGDVKKGISNPIKSDKDGSYYVILAEEVFPTSVPKTLEECRGYVVAEYQDYLEKNWNASLRQKYPVKVDESVFKSMVK